MFFEIDFKSYIQVQIHWFNIARGILESSNSTAIFTSL